MMTVADRACNIRLLIFDVDGVLTDGQILYGPDGEALKAFYAQDGMGIAVAQRAGIKTAIITGRESRMVSRRCDELRIGDVCQGAMDKVASLSRLLDKHGLGPEEACYMGDDLNDLAVMRRVGLSCAVANAVPEVRQAAHYVTSCSGGRGAVREVVELILKSQNRWQAILDSYGAAGPVETRQ